MLRSARQRPGFEKDEITGAGFRCCPFQRKINTVFFSHTFKFFDIASVISMLDSPAFCRASCFGVCLPWGILFFIVLLFI